jgi:hypothetical protein
MWRRVALVVTDVSEERRVSIIRVTRIGELGTTLAVTSNWRNLRRNTVLYRAVLCGARHLLVTANVVPSSLIPVTLMMDSQHSSETSVLTITIRRHIPEDGILHSHCRENLNFYIIWHTLNASLRKIRLRYIRTSGDWYTHETTNSLIKVVITFIESLRNSNCYGPPI